MGATCQRGDLAEIVDESSFLAEEGVANRVVQHGEHRGSLLREGGDDPDRYAGDEMRGALGFCGRHGGRVPSSTLAPPW